MRTTPERPVNVEELFPALADHRGTSTRLHPHRGSPSHHESSVGGPLLWPTDEPWPTCDGPHDLRSAERVKDIRLRRKILDEAWQRDAGGPDEEERAVLDELDAKISAAPSDLGSVPLLPVAQLFTKDVPSLEGVDGSDLLQVLWCPFDGHEGENSVDVRLRWRRSSEVPDVLRDQPEPIFAGREDYVPNPCSVDPELVTEHEYVGLLPAELQDQIDEWEEQREEEEEEITYQHDLSIPPGWKVGGFASWHLSGPRVVTCLCGSPMHPLLTIHNREWDNGTLSWVPHEDRDRIGRFRQNIPTEISFGRGHLWIFVCAADSSHPHHIRIQ